MLVSVYVRKMFGDVCVEEKRHLRCYNQNLPLLKVTWDYSPPLCNSYRMSRTSCTRSLGYLWLFPYVLPAFFSPVLFFMVRRHPDGS